jgi:hypothetical protein
MLHSATWFRYPLKLENEPSREATLLYFEEWTAP